MITNTWIVFDFDGTLADTSDYIYSLFKKYSSEFGLGEFTPHDWEMLRDRGLKAMAAQFKIPILKVMPMIVKFRKAMHEGIGHFDLIPGIDSLIAGLKRQNFGLGIASSNSEENINKFLDLKNIKIFDFVYGGGSIFGKDRLLKEMLKKENLSRESVIYIGDEIRDVEAARKAGIKIIAVTWGLSSRKALQREKPDYIADTPEEIYSIINST